MWCGRNKMDISNFHNQTTLWNEISNLSYPTDKSFAIILTMNIHTRINRAKRADVRSNI